MTIFLQDEKSRRRRHFLCAGLLFLVLPAVGVHALVLKIATVSPDGTMWMNKMREGAAEIEKRTDGRVTFKFYPGGVMGNDPTVLRKMRVGQLNGGAFPVGSLAKIYPDLIIYQLPFLFDSQNTVDAIRSEMDQQLINGMEQNGLIGFGFAGGGFAYIMSTSPARSIEEFKKRKVWVPIGDKISHAVFTTAGVSQIPLPLSDVLTGLQTGMIDTAAISPVGAIAFQWHTKITFLTDTPISYIYAVLALDRRTFNKIEPADQHVVREVMTRIYRQIDQQNRLDNIQAREALLQQGVTFVNLSPEELTEWKSVAAQTTEDLRRSGEFTPEILDKLQQHMKRIKP